MSTTHCIAFVGAKKVAEGSVTDVLRVLKPRFDSDPSDLPLIFDTGTGQPMDFDLRGTLDEVLTREDPAPVKKPGRPKLGVVSREVSLLERHWDWLEAQPNGISAAIRRLVEEAIHKNPEKERARRVRAATSRILSAIAGNRPGFEEAMRALFAGDAERFDALVKRWPKDVRELAVESMREAERADRLAAERL